MSIFKAYDIRGIYGQDLTQDVFYKIARAYARFIEPRKVVVELEAWPTKPPAWVLLHVMVADTRQFSIRLALSALVGMPPTRPEVCRPPLTSPATCRFLMVAPSSL